MDVTGVSPQRRNVSFVHQFFINYPNMTVWENIAFFPWESRRVADRCEI